MSVESERQDENRRDERGDESEARAGSGSERATAKGAAPPAQRQGSLNQRLQDLQNQSLAQPHAAMSRPVGAPAMHFPPAGQFDEFPPPLPPSAWPVRGLVVGLGASLLVGLLLAGWVKRVDILTAWRSSPRSTIDLYPPREEDAPARRVLVTVAETPPAPSAPSRVAALAPPAASELPGAAPAFAGPCGARLAHPEPGFVHLQLLDASRAGRALIVKVDDIDYRGQFAADGSFSLVAPKLSAAAPVRWAGSDGRPCSASAAAAAGEVAQLRVALVWEGSASLGLHILEPKAWLGSPAGHISAATPNTDRSRGAGRMHVFGAPGDPVRVAFYSVDLAQLGSPGVLNAIVKLEAPARQCAGGPATVRYQLHTARTGEGADPAPEVRAFAFQLPPCGDGAVDAPPVERVAIRF